MKIVLLILVLLIMSAGTFVYFKSQYGDIPIQALLTSDSRNVTNLARKFMEDIRFKDFKTASEYSLPEHKGVYDIPMLLERLFQVKPEFLDINKAQILSTELDSTGDRAKVNIQTDVKLLNTNELRKPNIILYWKKKDDNWYMDLASSIK